MQICLILRFSWSILVKCCVHLWTSSSKTQMLLLEKNIFHKYWLFCYGFIMFIFDLCGPFVFCLSFLNNNYVSTPSFNKSFWPDSRQILRHQYRISVAEWQTFQLAKRPQRRGARRNGCFRSYVASIYANLFHKRKRLHKKRVQLPQEWFGTLTWPPVSWRHVKTLNCFFMP